MLRTKSYGENGIRTNCYGKMVQFYILCTILLESNFVLVEMVQSRRLQLFGHVARGEVEQDNARALEGEIFQSKGEIIISAKQGENVLKLGK